jgi:hypothetical protein
LYETVRVNDESHSIPSLPFLLQANILYYWCYEYQTVSKLVKPGFSVLIEKGAGAPSYFSDADYEAAGAKIVDTDDVWKGSDIVMKVRIHFSEKSLYS